REQLGRRGHAAPETVFQVRDDRPGRGDRQLLAGDREDERPEGVERRELVHPRPRAKVRPGVDQLPEDGVSLLEVLARLRIGGGGLAMLGGHAQNRNAFQTVVDSRTSPSRSSPWLVADGFARRPRSPQPETVTRTSTRIANASPRLSSGLQFSTKDAQCNEHFD